MFGDILPLLRRCILHATLCVCQFLEEGLWFIQSIPVSAAINLTVTIQLKYC